MSAADALAMEGISGDEIRRHIETITASPVLTNSTQLCRFLRYIVDRTLAGDTGSLKENLLGTAVFERGIRYDPRTDPVVRVEARRLRAKLEEYYDTYGSQSLLLVELPKGSYIPVFRRRPRPQLVSISKPSAEPDRKAVAVLPFASVGADPETDYFADGLTDEVMTLLGTVPGLQVVSRSSVYQFKNRTADARELGRALNASHLVEGSVRRHGQRVRIAVQLVESANGYQGWAGTFERDWHEIFAIQTEIAAAIALTLRGRATESSVPRSTAYTENLEAYNALLRGRYYTAKRSVVGFRAAMEAYNQAIALDAAYAPAWAGLADCHSMLGFLNATSPLESRANARLAAERALALDANLAAAHVAVGNQTAIYEWDWPRSQAALRRALELDSNNADAHYGLSKILASLGRVDEALPFIFRAEQLDPLSLSIKSSLGWELGLAERYREADRAFQTAHEFDPYFGGTYLLWSWSQQSRGMIDEAIGFLQLGTTLIDSTLVQGELAHALGKKGEVEEARKILERMLLLSRTRFVSPFDLARAYEGLGERDKALQAMSEACDQRTPMLLFAGADPVFDPFRGDPRFTEILRRMNLDSARPL